jgi:hypothetical protein
LVAALPQLEKRFNMLVAPTNVAIEANCEILDQNGVKFLSAPSLGNGTLAERHTLFAQVKTTEVYTKFVKSCSAGKPDFHELGELLQEELASAQVFLSTVHHTMSPAEHLERAWLSIADDVGLSSQDAYGILKATASLGATASLAGRYRCDTFIVDEAGAVSCQALISELLHMDPRRVVLAGDPRQARPFSNLDKHAPSLLEVLNHYREDCSGFENPAVLCEVWRMGLVNTRMVSDVCYSSQLVSMQPDYLGGRDQVFHHDVKGSEELGPGLSWVNVAEANEVTELVAELQQVRPNESILVISFYTAQVALLRDRLPSDVRVVTVDSAQGSEADIVILSCVRTGEARTVGFLKDSHRITVALSRQRHQLHIVGHLKELAHHVPMFKGVIEHAEQPQPSDQATLEDFIPNGEPAAAKSVGRVLPGETRAAVQAELQALREERHSTLKPLTHKKDRKRIRELNARVKTLETKVATWDLDWPQPEPEPETDTDTDTDSHFEPKAPAKLGRQRRRGSGQPPKKKRLPHGAFGGRFAALSSSDDSDGCTDSDTDEC